MPPNCKMNKISKTKKGKKLKGKQRKKCTKRALLYIYIGLLFWLLHFPIVPVTFVEAVIVPDF